jgi:DDE family transposase
MRQDKWLNCRLVDIQQRLDALGHAVSKPVISRLLQAHDYHLRANVKQAGGSNHPDRDRQFCYIREQRTHALAQGVVVISVDTKKKELIGNFKNAGQTWGQSAEVVDAHDFPHDAIGRAVPYGIYDMRYNCGTVYVGQSADTPAFAVANLAHWVGSEMHQRYPHATQLMIEADSGGSNAARSRVWKHHLQAQLADRFGLTISVYHYPPGTSKWNPIEHRLFSEISKTWAGCPLRSFELMLQYLTETKTQTGLRVQAHLVTETYAAGERVSDAVLATLQIQAHEVCPQWNYTIRPRAAILDSVAGG